jgi:hypothetical protein
MLDSDFRSQHAKLAVFLIYVSRETHVPLIITNSIYIGS